MKVTADLPVMDQLLAFSLSSFVPINLLVFSPVVK